MTTIRTRKGDAYYIEQRMKRFEHGKWVTKSVQSAPFYAMRFIKTVSGIEGACYPRPAILGRSGAVLNIQPMSVISRELLMAERFNEDIVNGLEDTELAVRLSRRCGHHWKIDPEWHISHRGGASFKKDGTRPGLFIYNDDRQFRHNFQVFANAVNSANNSRRKV